MLASLYTHICHVVHPILILFVLLPLTEFDDDGAKRHRTGNHWVYQRRDARDAQAARAAAVVGDVRKEIRPVIHVSKPDSKPATQNAAPRPVVAAQPQTKTLSPRPSLQKLRQERRRFHLSRSALSSGSGSTSQATGMSKRRSTSPAVFVERGRKKLIHQALHNATQQAQETTPPPEARPQVNDTTSATGTKQVFKKPGTKKAKPQQQGGPTPAPLPASVAKPHTEDLDKIADEMNRWVLNEIGANLHQMEVEKKQAPTPRFKPRAPPQRYSEKQRESLQPPPPADSTMSDVTDEEADDDDEDWVIDEYVRIPAKSMSVDISPADVGVLVLDGDDDNTLFFGDDYDEEDEYLEDDEDENGKRFLAR